VYGHRPTLKSSFTLVENFRVLHRERDQGFHDLLRPLRNLKAGASRTTGPSVDQAWVDYSSGKAKTGDNVLWGRPSTTFWAWACERVLRPCKSTRVSGTDQALCAKGFETASVCIAPGTFALPRSSSEHRNTPNRAFSRIVGARIFA
jgi:hypothetical protein